MNINKYPHELSRGTNNVVIALSKTEVGKIFTPDSRVEVTTEARNMQYANKINDLVAAYIRIDIEGDNQILVMERLSILEPRSFEKEVREAVYSVFVDKIKELHKQGFCHRDIKRPSGFGGRPYDNVILTEEGLRLIDTGISAIRDSSNENIFARYVEAEMKEAAEFFEYFMEQ
jgi:serine/threonine protein kinase